jgi:hypothetical protein
MKPLAVVVLLASTSAHAQVLTHVAVNVSCAEDWHVTKQLELRLDGVPQAPLGIETKVTGVYESADGSTGISTSHDEVDYFLAQGPHHLALTTPDCAGSTDLVLGPGSNTVSGRLTTTNSWLRGTATSDGSAITLGGYAAWRPAHAYPDTTSGGMERGALASIALDDDHFVAALDQELGSGGGATPSPADPAVPSVVSSFAWRSALRFGGRVVYRDIALAAGAGIGGDLVIDRYVDERTPIAEDNVEGHFFVPVWATLLYKPICNWGVQVTGTYEVHPTEEADDAPMLSVGVTWQPSTACSQTPHLDLNTPG